MQSFSSRFSTLFLAIACGLIVCFVNGKPPALHATPTIMQPDGLSVPLAPLSDIRQIQAGGAHTCAVTTAGSTFCWGNNFWGQLGDGRRIERHTPAPVIGSNVAVQAITAGVYHTCSLNTAGGVACWGYNKLGQVGDGSATIWRRKPVAVTGLSSGVQAITTSAYHTCALTTAGTVLCWGDNYSGQVGNGSTMNQPTPSTVAGLNSSSQAITAGRFHTCALTTAGAVRCWGDNLTGQLGDGSTTNQLIPSAVVGLHSGVQAITAGAYHTCALTTAGAVRCWGYNRAGQLGDGSTTDRLTSVAVRGLGSGVRAITTGAEHTCALTTAGSVLCWGDNSNGQLGDSTWTNRSTPVAVTGLSSGVQAIAAGGRFTCALTTAGGALCWGNNGFGQLGNDTTTHKNAPSVVLMEPPATITIAKEAQPDSATNFRFRGWLGAFYLDDITPQDGDSYSQNRSILVAAGIYTVTEVVPSTWLLADIACNPTANSTVDLTLNRVTLTVAAGENVNCTFTNHYKATFNTVVFDDQDQDRRYDAGEPGLSAWTMRVYDSNNTELLAKTTDTAGVANFTRQIAPNATYKVCVDVAAGWIGSVPAALDPVLGKPCYTHTLTAGQTLTLRFGNKPQSMTAANEDITTETMEDVTSEEALTIAPDESGYDASYVEEEETTPPPADQPAPTQSQLLFLPLISNNTPSGLTQDGQ